MACETLLSSEIVCEGWTNSQILPGCVDFVTGKTKKSTKNCELNPSDEYIKAIRSDCYGDNGVAISTTLKDINILVYCDSDYIKSISVNNLWQTLQSNCELRYVDKTSEVEKILLGQTHTDLINPYTNTNNQMSESNHNNSIDLDTIILYGVPLGMATLILISILLCCTIFCLRPSKFRDFLNCIRKQNNSNPPEPNSKQASMESIPLRSLMNSKNASRNASPSRLSNNKAQIVSSY
jgi:hypothetical protein